MNDNSTAGAPPPPPLINFDAEAAIDPDNINKKKAEDEDETNSLYPSDFAGCEPPAELWKNRRIGKKRVKDESAREEEGGRLHLCGVGEKSAPIMFVGSCPLGEDYRPGLSSVGPMLLKSAPGNLFKRSLLRVGLQPHDWFYTTVCKYNVPQSKPTARDLRWNEAILLNEINTIKPKIIVCMGKAVFDFLWAKATGKALKFRLRDVQGGFFESPKFGCVLYPMDTIMTPLMKPEFLERFETDLQQIRRALDEMQGFGGITKVEQHYVTIENTATLINVLTRIMMQKVELLGVDCEWHGQTWVDGKLRSFQFSWAPGYAAYLKLMDEKQKYCFDQPLENVHGVIRPVFSNPAIRFVGHNASADMPWLKHHLGIEVYRRVAFDTMYALHTVNEYADLKLERCSVKYTDLGRYDIQLCLWKKENGFDEDNEPGYGRVPDRIIIPYALKDVDATMRLWPVLQNKLEQEGLTTYYNDFVLPFVTDGFFELMETGLPINEEYLTEMRAVFTRNQELLLKTFRNELYKDAVLRFHKVLMMFDGKTATDRFVEILNGIRKNTVDGLLGPSPDSTAI